MCRSQLGLDAVEKSSVCVRVCVSVCVSACVCVTVRACVQCNKVRQAPEHIV